MDLIKGKDGSLGIFEGKLYAVGENPYLLKKDEEVEPFEGSISIENPLDMFESMMHILNEDYSDYDYVSEFLEIEDEEIVDKIIRNKTEELNEIFSPDELKRIKRRYNRLRKFYLRDGNKSVDIFIHSKVLSSNLVLFIFEDKSQNQRSLIKLDKLSFKVFIEQLLNNIKGSLLFSNNQTGKWVSLVKNNGHLKAIDSDGNVEILNEIQKKKFAYSLEDLFEIGKPYYFRDEHVGIISRKGQEYIIINNKEFPILGYGYKLYGLFKS